MNGKVPILKYSTYNNILIVPIPHLIVIVKYKKKLSSLHFI